MSENIQITFQKGRCPKCGRNSILVLSNNPLSGNTICFDCVKNNLDYNNLEHADFFCRTYNLPYDPEKWILCAKEFKDNCFMEYSRLVLEDAQNRPNLAYESSTKDIWSKANKEWERCRTLGDILKRIEPIQDSYIDRARMKWGEQYTFSELLKLDSIYTQTLKANNITNPLQKQAVQTLCKLQIEMDEAIRAKDAKAIKDFSTAWSTFAKQADLETMINETKTDDITTVAELYDYMERQGFQFKFYDGYVRDEIDMAIKDIQAANRKLILESTGLEQQLNDMIEQRTQNVEQTYAEEIAAKDNIADLMGFTAEDGEIATEDDDSVLEMEFESDEDEEGPTIIHREVS